MKFRRWTVLVCALAMLSMFAIGMSGISAASDKFKVGFIYSSPVGDMGWAYEHNRGRLYLVEKLPDVETVYVENVPESSDAERVLTQLAEAGCKVIFACSFGYMDFVHAVAERYPDVIFMHNTGFKTAENVGIYFGRIYQARYLTGMVAGKMTESNLVGYVAAMPIPEVVRGINAFALGVRSVNPDAVVKVVWTNTWYDPAREKDAAKSLIEAGCDIIAQHQNSPAPQQAAGEAGVYGIGYNTDMRQFAPDAVLTNPVWNWGPFYVDCVEAVRNGTWKSPYDYWGGLEDAVVDVGPYGPMVPEDIKELVIKKKSEIAQGKFKVFEGPIKDNKGVERVKPGQVMTDQELLSFDWFVEGVEGTLN